MKRREDSCNGCDLIRTVPEQMSDGVNEGASSSQKSALVNGNPSGAAKQLKVHFAIEDKNKAGEGSMDVDDYCEAGIARGTEVQNTMEASENEEKTSDDVPDDVLSSSSDNDEGEAQMEGNKNSDEPMEEEERSEENGGTGTNLMDENPGTSSGANNDQEVDDAPVPRPFFGPPPIEIVISFDTTGSMSYYLDEVKNQINDIINRLFMDIPNLKIGLIAHGDYCDEKVYYLTQKMDFTNDINSLCEMVRNVEGTGGGDFAECYELIFRQVRLMKWSPGSQRALIMIGDACPHTPEELRETRLEEIDWRVEASALMRELVSLYS